MYWFFLFVFGYYTAMMFVVGPHMAQGAYIPLLQDLYELPATKMAAFAFSVLSALGTAQIGYAYSVRLPEYAGNTSLLTFVLILIPTFFLGMIYFVPASGAHYYTRTQDLRGFHWWIRGGNHDFVSEYYGAFMISGFVLAAIYQFGSKLKAGNQGQYRRFAVTMLMTSVFLYFTSRLFLSRVLRAENRLNIEGGLYYLYVLSLALLYSVMNEDAEKLPAMREAVGKAKGRSSSLRAGRL